jgi:hypothetical protein
MANLHSQVVAIARVLCLQAHGWDLWETAKRVNDNNKQSIDRIQKILRHNKSTFSFVSRRCAIARRCDFCVAILVAVYDSATRGLEPIFQRWGGHFVARQRQKRLVFDFCNERLAWLGCGWPYSGTHLKERNPNSTFQN